MAIVKICGLSEPLTLMAALEAGADMVGFVFFERSPRHVTTAVANALGRRVERRADKVALTVDAGDGELDRIVAALSPDLLQLHGHETPERVATVRARYGLPVIKAIGLATAADAAQVSAFEPFVEYLMFDAPPTSDASRPGGNGTAFDWSLLRRIASTRPWLLAGGLNDGNVAQALAATAAAGVDVSSGVESSPGVKDPERIARFVAQARQASERLGLAATIG